jgi:hypothetical protein
MLEGRILVFDSGDKQKAIDEFTQLNSPQMMLMLINFEVKFCLN